MHSLARSQRFTVLAGLISVLVTVFTACSPKTSEVVVATVGDRTITLPEYESLYIKSNGGNREQAAASTQEDREKFLGLMTKFRLKLADAYGREMDKNSDVLKEIAQYRGSLAASYLTERDITEPGVKKLYDRRNEEIRASHILMTCGPDASPSDTEKAYGKAVEIITAIKGGGDFTALALEHSQDPSVKQTKGDLYYFSGGRMVPNFEDAVFAMKPGQTSTVPIRTVYGYHVVKVVDRRPSPGERLCSHIMIRFEKQDPPPEDTLAAYQKIKAIQDSLAMGLDFAELAQRNSGDPGSAPRGGDLGWFSRGRWILPFDEIAFTLKPGQLSGIVRTVYGYHIIKCYDTRPVKPFEEAKKELQSLYQQQRFQDDFQRFVSKLKRDMQVVLHENVVSQLIASLDTNKTTRDSAWASGVSPALGTSALMSCAGHPVSVDSILAILRSRPDLNTLSLRAESVRSACDKIAEQFAFAAKGEALERQDPEFAKIMNEYKEGILLYQVEQEQVWNRIAVSDSALHQYFNAHRPQFTYPDRVEFSEIRATNDSLARVIRARVAGGATFEQVAAADSVRMGAPTSTTVLFLKNSSKIQAAAAKSLAQFTTEMKADAAVKIQVTVHPDTTDKKAGKLATRRLEAVKSYLAKELRLPTDRILGSSQPPTKDPSTMTAAEKDSLNSIVRVDLVGRTPIVQGRVTTELLPVTTDERTKKADSLAVGQTSSPFEYRGTISIVRVNRKDPARQKSFEEAGTEVSSAFQEYESKRLENEWLDGLKKVYPLVEYKQALKSAFVPVK